MELAEASMALAAIAAGEEVPLHAGTMPGNCRAQVESGDLGTGFSLERAGYAVLVLGNRGVLGLEMPAVCAAICVPR